MLATFRSTFIAGLLVLVPIAITLWVLNSIISILDQSLLLLPKAWQPNEIFGFDVLGLGTLLTLIIILITGIAARNFLGGRLLQISDYIFQHVPVVRTIYSGVKQVSDTLLSSKGNAFSKALLVRYPHSQSWTIGFLTGSPNETIAMNLTGEHISVFVPTTPNPTSGFMLIVPKTDVIELSISVDQALKYVVSMGVVSANDPIHARP